MVNAWEPPSKTVIDEVCGADKELEEIPLVAAPGGDEVVRAAWPWEVELTLPPAIGAELEAVGAEELEATGVTVDDGTLELSWEAPKFPPVETPVTYVVIAVVETLLTGQYVVVNVFVTSTVDPDAFVEAETTIWVSVVRLLESVDTEDGTAEAAVAGQYVVVNVLVISSVTPAEFVEVETTTPVSVVKLLGPGKEDLIDPGVDVDE